MVVSSDVSGKLLLPSSVLSPILSRSIATKPWDLEPRFSPVINFLNNAISTLPQAKLFPRTQNFTEEPRLRMVSTFVQWIQHLANEMVINYN